MNPETLQDLCGRILTWIMVTMAPVGQGGLPRKQKHDKDQNVAQKKAKALLSRKRRKPEETQDASSSDSKRVERVKEEEEKKKNRGGEDVTCPLSKIDFNHCDWRGPLRSLKEHVPMYHWDVLRRDNSFQCKALENRVLLLFYQGDIFLYCKRISYTGHMYLFVQQVGLNDRLYSCRIRIASKDESREDIDTRFRINSITETLELSAETGKCLAIDVREIEYYIRYDKIDMLLTIEEFHEH